MLKNYFTDGLVQVAIVLSLLRTDLNSYINSVYTHDYPEIQEIILGTSTAYTQTHFHTPGWHSGVINYPHPKSIDSYYADSVFQELHSLSHYRRFEGVNTNLNAWLIDPVPVSVPSENAGTDNSQHNAEATTNASDGPAAENAQVEGAVSPPDWASVFPGTDCTKEDVELIEILLQQDIDLGVGREAYDLNFRREKEKKELEAQQNHEKHLNDLAQQELQEQGQSQQPNPNMRYIVDDDTGETVAVPMESNETVALPEGYVAPESAAPTTNGYSGNVNLVPSQITSSVNSSVAMQHVNITRELTSQIQNLQNDIDNMTETAQNISLLADQPSTSGSILQHQNSIDARWEDVVSFINDENTTDVAATPGNMTFSGDVAATPGNMTFSGDVAATPSNMTFSGDVAATTGNMTFSGDLAALPNNSIDDLLLTANDSSASPLLQNATLGLPNITPTFELDAPNFPSTSDQNITNAGQLFQSTSSNQSFFDMDNGSYLNMLGNSQPMNITGINTTGNFLENLLNDNIGDVDMMEFSSGAPQTSPLLDDASSDSAVSSMSAASQLQDFNDTNTNRSTSPTNSLQSAAAGSESSYGSSLQNGTFDGLEGATAGEEYSKSTGSTYIKQERTYSSGYESPDYGFRGDDYNLNYSSTSNDSDYHYHPASMRHVNHNHTYPLQPGQEPRETQSKKNSPRDKIPRSRDDKKAKAHKLPFSTDEIINSPVERFSEMLTKHPFTETQLQLLKDIRRRGKNKLAAQNCRKRKIDAVDDISGNVTSLRAERNRLMKEKGQIDKQKREMEAKMSHLYREVFTSLRDDHGNPYDPSQYSLQQTADGDVFLLPFTNSTTAANTHKEKNHRKRKGKKD